MESRRELRAIDALVAFARRVSDDRGSAEVLPHLAEALHEHAAADAVVVLGIERDGSARVRGTACLEEALAVDAFDADEIDLLRSKVLAASGARYEDARAHLLVAGGNLFGVAVMLFVADRAADSDPLRLAEGLVDLASVALSNASQVDRLERSYEELRASQDMLARTEALRALGQLAAGVSHDLKNMLNPLSLSIQVAMRALARNEDDDVRASLVEMKGVITRGVETLERLRAYSQPSKESKSELLDLDRLVQEAAAIARPRMAAAGALRIEQQLHAPPPIVGVGVEIVSALVNLIVNAIDAAVVRGERITLRTGEADGGSWVEVEDDGHGMSPEVERRVFEPFFTTKGIEGTGLGLAMVYATVQRHGGKVTLVTREGNGTRFRLWFTSRPPCGGGG